MSTHCPHCGGALDRRDRARRGVVDARCDAPGCDRIFETFSARHRFCSTTCRRNGRNAERRARYAETRAAR